MTQNLAKYHARTPRYTLHTQDNTLIRLAGPKQVPWEEGTEIKNISLTGLVFTAPSDLCPSLGEFIKIEYEIPGSKKTACHALVTRVENHSNSKTLVGVKFYKMEMSQRIILAQGLALRLREQQIRKMEERRLRLGMGSKYMPALLLGLWLVLFYLSSSWSWLNYFLNQSR